jgi:hypothetical protein
MKHILFPFIWIDKFIQFYVDTFAHAIAATIGIPVKWQRYGITAILIIFFAGNGLVHWITYGFSTQLIFAPFLALAFILLQKTNFLEDTNAEQVGKSSVTPTKKLLAKTLKIVGLVRLAADILFFTTIFAVICSFSFIALGYILLTPNQPPPIKEPKLAKVKS